MKAVIFDTERIVATALVKKLPDPGDIPFLEVALTAGVPLITGNVRHFPPSLCRGHPVFTPSGFMNRLYSR